MHNTVLSLAALAIDVGQKVKKQLLYPSFPLVLGTSTLCLRNLLAVVNR